MLTEERQPVLLVTLLRIRQLQHKLANFALFTGRQVAVGLRFNALFSQVTPPPLYLLACWPRAWLQRCGYGIHNISHDCCPASRLSTESQRW